MFQLIYLRFTQPRADPTVFATMASRAKALLANRAASPDVVFNQTVELGADAGQSAAPAGDGGDRGSVESREGARLLQGAVRGRQRLHLRLRRQLHARDAQAVRRAIPRQPAGDACARPSLETSDITPPRGVVEKSIEKGIAPKSQVAIVLSGPIEYDQAHLMAFRTVTLLLQSRLLDTIRQELGGTYAITVNPDVDKLPAPDLHGADRLDLRPGAHRGADAASPRRDRRRAGVRGCQKIRWR